VLFITITISELTTLHAGPAEAIIATIIAIAIDIRLNYQGNIKGIGNPYIMLI
jgi:hypothetical protein